ncbi:MAG: thiamine pyrophosphate-binding protein [Beijerinckiaceae bacterium]|nr:thiamine pyrophosphate-binding protein [Beijerinckiaceae bacterium]
MKSIDRPSTPVNTPPLAWKSDIVARLLRESGIPYITLNPGASYRGLHDSLVNYLGNQDPQMLLCLHEDHVVAIAHGYAKATDRPLACVLHSNVGLMHGLMGIFNAWADRVPMLILGATGPVQPEKRRPWIDWIHTAKDQGALLRNYVKWDDEPRSMHGLIEGVIRGLQITTTAPRAPVYICLDAGLQEEPIEGELTLPDLARFAAPAPPSGSPEEIEQVATMIGAAQRPLFLFGRGSRLQEDWDRRVALAERTGAAVLTSLRERAVFPTEHPQHIGPPSGWMSAGAKAALQDADLVVSFDWIDLNGYLQQFDRQTSRIGAKIVHVSLDSLLHNGWSMDHFGLPPADTLVMADPDRFLKQLLTAVEAGAAKGKTPWRAPAPVAPRGYGANASTELVPHDIEAALAEVRGDRDFTIAHTTIGWAATDYAFRGPLDYLGHDGGGGLAAGPGLTIGAALALKDSGRTVIGILGDGDFMQGATALWSAAHYQLPALFIISNNRSNFNDEIHQEAVAKVRERPVDNRWIGQRIDEPAIDLAGLARAQGIESVGPIGNVADLLAAIRQGLEVVASGKPFFIDARVKPGYANIIVSRHS